MRRRSGIQLLIKRDFDVLLIDVKEKVRDEAVLGVNERALVDIVVCGDAAVHVIARADDVPRVALHARFVRVDGDVMDDIEALQLR